MIKKIKITVYCASSENISDIYLENAFELGSKLAKSGCEIIYGGGKAGLMGRLADGALSSGGKVTGIIPEFMKEKELGHTGVSSLVWVLNFHQRQKLMMESADIIMALPGGCGTYAELFEAITWKKHGNINCPILIINLNKYFNELINILNKAIDEGFMRIDDMHIWSLAGSVSDAVRYVHNFKNDYLLNNLV